jgi:hypothetical protein
MLCVLSVVVVPIWIAQSDRNKTIGDPTSPVAQAPSQSPLPIRTPSQNNYDRGFKSGSDYGKLIGAHPESGGMGTEEAIAQDARGSAIRDDRTREDADWQRGWIDGYKKGFISLRGAGRKEEDFEKLSWSNAFPNVKLYNHARRQVATIIDTEPISGLITVRYKRAGLSKRSVLKHCRVYGL